MNEIKVFNNSAFGQVRTAGTSENPLFCLSDVCKAVDLSNPSSVKTRLDKDDVQLIDLHALNGGQEIVGNSLATFVTESGFYEVILFSNSPKVKPFRKWVTKEVLPSIRKTGQYSANVPQTFSQALMLAAKQQEQIEEQRAALAQQGEEIVKLSNEVMTMKPKATYYDLILNNPSTVTITQIAQDYGMSAKKFNQILCDFRIQHKVNKQWILYADNINKGYVQSKPTNIPLSNGTEKVVYNTEWTQKGRIFLYEKLKRNGILPMIENKQLFDLKARQ